MTDIQTDALARTTAIILAGGMGTRLRAAVGDRPKPMAEINGRPFLDYQIAQLGRAGIRDTLICVGYGAQTIVAAMGDSRHGVRLRYIRDWPLRGTGGALRNALPAISTTMLLVINGDSYSGANLAKFAAAHVSCQKAQCSILLASRENRDAFGGVVIDRDGRVESFQEKQSGTGPGYVNAGVYLLSRSVLAEIPANKVVSWERQMLPRLIGHGLYGWVDPASFIDIGTPESFRHAHAFLREDTAA